MRRIPDAILAPETIAKEQGAMNSTGPSTPEGKATSSQNARKHGLFAVPKVTLDNESDDQFRELFAATLQRIAPKHRHELDAVNDAAISRWRLERTWELEAALVNKALRELRAANPNPEISEAERSAVAFDKAYQDSKCTTSAVERPCRASANKTSPA